MSSVYVLVSKELSQWAQRTGLGNEVVKVGYTNDSVRIRLLALKTGEYGGVKDWQWPDGSDLRTIVGETVEAEVHRILRERGVWLDPQDHPHLKDEFGKPSRELFATTLDNALSVVRDVETKTKSRRHDTVFPRRKKVRRKRSFRSLLRRFIVGAVLLALAMIALGKLLEDDPARQSGAIRLHEEKTAKTKPSSEPAKCFVADKELDDGRTEQHRICLDADGVWRGKGTL